MMEDFRKTIIEYNLCKKNYEKPNNHYKRVKYNIERTKWI